ncbi:MAG: hypothetical protein AAF585_01705 [Verrucomicrobiota bacterium]
MIFRIHRLLTTLALAVGVSMTFSSCSLLKNMDPERKSVGKAADLGPVSDLRPMTPEEESGDLGIKDVFPDYNRDALSPKAKIFLVAGGADIANFLQEVVDQREYFLRLGYQPEEIACYYVKPTQKHYAADQAQFASLAPKASGFYLAAPHVLYRHLQSTAMHSPEFIYLYVTSHGRQPLLPGVTLTEQPRPDEVFLIQKHPNFSGQYRLDLMGGPSGHMNLRMRVAALDDGVAPDHLFLTPRYLKKALSAFPAATPKVVVLQGCYSGGFVKTDIKSLENDALSKMSNIVLLSASASERQSFGCKVDTDYTYWGGLYVHTLRDEYASPIPETPWALVAASVEEKVDDLEIQLGLPEAKTSNPLYFSNVTPVVVDGPRPQPQPTPAPQSQPAPEFSIPEPTPALAPEPEPAPAPAPPPGIAAPPAAAGTTPEIEADFLNVESIELPSDPAEESLASANETNLAPSPEESAPTGE